MSLGVTCRFHQGRPLLDNLLPPCRHTCALAHFYRNEIVLVLKGEIYWLRGSSLVPVMQATDLRKLNDFSHRRWLNWSLIRRILLER